ncbi:cellulose-binding domain-containing protein [Dehalobacter sp. DCM]|uniref:cellulose binding domain-containing protein n=1 Tax=Dehalobacter sp. DCM TaxID=2907827 RepID=UPI0030815AAF|nr:cellulose-binding domain-containing protein [Dehalobacter sp. DCM]
MRKIILLSILLLTILSSVVAGTLAMYTTSIDNLADGSVVAKEFIFLGDGTDTFQQGIKIAPSETVSWRFKVKNYQNQVITETDLYYKLTFNVQSSPGKNAITPLKVIIKDGNGNTLNSIDGVGTLDVLGTFPLAAAGQFKDYIVEIQWPGNRQNDINYAGSNFGTTVNVAAVASQVPLTGSDHENSPQQKQVSVKYETTVPWQNGQSHNYQYQYKITVTNNTLTPITSWNMAFSLTTNRLSDNYWNAVLVSNSPQGSYTFGNPNYNNTATDTIQPGQSISFGGIAKGMGNEAIQNILIGGSNTSGITDVDLTCQFNKSSLD